MTLKIAGCVDIFFFFSFLYVYVFLSSTGFPVMFFIVFHKWQVKNRVKPWSSKGNRRKLDSVSYIDETGHLMDLSVRKILL